MNMALRRYRVLFVSLELTPGEIAMRGASRFSTIPYRRLEEGLRTDDREPLTEKELGQWDQATGKFHELVLYLRIHGADENGRELSDVMRSATRHNYDAVFLDHIGMVGRDSAGNDLEKIKETIHRLRALSRGEVNPRCRPFVCATSPLNRDSQKGEDDEPREPRLADFYGSSRVEYDTDAAVILRKRKGKGDEGPDIVDAFVLKNRQGPCPKVFMFDADGARCSITERRKDDEPRPPHWQDGDKEEDQP